MNDPRVVAGGGLVIDDDGRLLVVHRPRYDDWTFPKGKQDPGETIEECALREVREETGFECELLDAVTMVSYVDHLGRDKDVHYWWMRRRSGRFVPNDEVDQLRWVTAEEAATLLSYARDLEVLVQAAGAR